MRIGVHAHRQWSALHKMMKESETISIKEAAYLLRVSEATIQRWVREGVIPVVYGSARSARFDPAHLAIWARDKGFYLSGDEQSRKKISVHLSEAIQRGGVHYDCVASDVKTACLLMANTLNCCRDWATEKRALFAENLYQREEQISTAIGEGIAIPHLTRVGGWGQTEPAVGFFFLHKPIAWGSVDDQPVLLLVLVFSTSIANHLELLSQITRWIDLPDTRPLLDSIPDYDQLLKGIHHAPVV